MIPTPRPGSRGGEAVFQGTRKTEHFCPVFSSAAGAAVFFVKNQIIQICRRISDHPHKTLSFPWRSLAIICRGMEIVQ